MKERIAIVGGVRTPFARAGEALRGFGADDLGAIVVKELVARTGVPVDQIDEVIFGNVAQPIDAANVARVIALKAGLPTNLIASTVHRNCASGMEAITTGAAKILSGESEVILAGGTESMSNIPLIYGRRMTELFSGLFRAKTLPRKLRVLSRFRPSFLKPVVGLLKGLTDPVCGLNMGKTAELLAREFHISREEQDQFALLSHQRAVAATQEGCLAGELVPVPVPPNYNSVLEIDGGPRPQQSMADLARLRPFFDRQTGTVTAGNSCPVTDGAGCVLVMREEKARELGLTPAGFLVDYAYAALDGRRMGLGPVYATAKLLDRSGFSMSSFELIELNEAFAAQVIANERAFASDAFAREYLGRDEAVGELDRDRLNVNGGAIALGHPVGTSGIRLVITLLGELRRRSLNRGLATLCVGGGQGAALALEAA